MSVPVEDLVRGGPRGIRLGSFALGGVPPAGLLAWFADGLRTVMLDQGYAERPAGPRRPSCCTSSIPRRPSPTAARTPRPS